MRALLRSRIDPNEPLYDGQARMSAAMAVLTGTPANGAKAPIVQKNRAPIAPTTSSRHHRAFRRHDAMGLQVARRALRPDRRVVGATRFYQPSARVADQFKYSARIPEQRSAQMGSAMLMAHSRRVRGPVANRAQALDGIKSRAMAQTTINTLRHRWNHVNRPDLSDGIVHAHHLRRHARNNNRDNKVNPLLAATLMFG